MCLCTQAGLHELVFTVLLFGFSFLHIILSSLACQVNVSDFCRNGIELGEHYEEIAASLKGNSA